MATQVMAVDGALRAIVMEQRELRKARVVGGLMLRDLESAAELLFAGVLRGRKLKTAMAEIEMNTRNQPFRIDTPHGPLFAEQCLWEFAGRSGNEFTGSVSREPTWPALQARAMARLREHVGARQLAIA